MARLFVFLLLIQVLRASIKYQGRDLSAFEIFQAAFQLGQSPRISEFTIEQPLAPKLSKDIRDYLQSLPLCGDGWMSVWWRWQDEFTVNRQANQYVLVNFLDKISHNFHPGELDDYGQVSSTYEQLLNVLLDHVDPENEVDRVRLLQRLAEPRPVLEEADEHFPVLIAKAVLSLYYMFSLFLTLMLLFGDV